jgi:hypothetical protein
MKKTAIIWAAGAIALLALVFCIVLLRGKARPADRQAPTPQGVAQAPAPVAVPSTSRAPLIFYFSPPTGFSDENLFWKDHHYIARVGRQGIERVGMVRVQTPAMNYSQSAYDPSTGTLYTWKKNYKASVDEILRLSVSDPRCQPVSAIPVAGSFPVLAVDSRRQRILVAGDVGYGEPNRPNFHIYDLATKRWQSGRFKELQFMTLAYLERDGVFVGLARTWETDGPQGTALIRVDASGNVVGRLPVKYEASLKRPLSSHGARYSLPNNPGLQSRVLNDALVLMRYCDLGREAVTAPFAWVYEVYHINVDTGEMKFAGEFE